MTQKEKIETIRFSFSGVAFQEDGEWCAHCLELDIVAHGNDPHDAMDNLWESVDLQITAAMEEDNLPQVFRAAPPEIFLKFAQGKDIRLVTKTKSLSNHGVRSAYGRNMVSFVSRQLAAI